MNGAGERSFPGWVKLIVDRICQSEALSRQELADSLDLHIHSVSTAAYRGEIGFDLVERLAMRAKTTAEELTEVELAWLQMRAQRPRNDALRHALEMLRARRAHLLAVEEWLRRRKLLGAWRRVSKRDPLVARTIERMKRLR